MLHLHFYSRNTWKNLKETIGKWRHFKFLDLFSGIEMWRGRIFCTFVFHYHHFSSEDRKWIGIDSYKNIITPRISHAAGLSELQWWYEWWTKNSKLGNRFLYSYDNNMQDMLSANLAPMDLGLNRRTELQEVENSLMHPVTWEFLLASIVILCHKLLFENFCKQENSLRMT